MSKENLLKCFSECSTGILLAAEIQTWFKERQLDDSNLQGQLQSLVDNGEIGQRAITFNSGDKEHTIYWFKNKAHATPTNSKVLLSTTPHSSKLRDRLKRNRRNFVSPLLSSKKKPKLDQEHHDKSVSEGIQGKLEFSHHDSPDTTPKTSSDDQEVATVVQNTMDKAKCPQTGLCSRLESLRTERNSLEAMLTQKREKLRKLKMVKMYRSKNDLQSLKSLSRQWREVSQEAAEVLLGYSTHQPRPSMTQLLEHFHIDFDLIQYSLQDENFY